MKNTSEKTEVEETIDGKSATTVQKENGRRRKISWAEIAEMDRFEPKIISKEIDNKVRTEKR